MQLAALVRPGQLGGVTITSQKKMDDGLETTSTEEMNGPGLTTQPKARLND